MFKGIRQSSFFVQMSIKTDFIEFRVELNGSEQKHDVFLTFYINKLFLTLTFYPQNFQSKYLVFY